MSENLHPQIRIMKENRLAELQKTIDSAQGEMATIRRELGLEKLQTGNTPAQQFQNERDSKPSPFAPQK